MKKYSGLLGTLGISLALATYGAQAQDEGDEGGGSDEVVETEFSAEGGSEGLGAGDRRFYVAPMFSYTLADSDRNTKDGIGGIMSIGKRLTSGLNLELTATYNELDSEVDSQTVELTGAGAAAMIFPVQSLPGLYGILALHHGSVKNHPTSPIASTGFDYRTTIFDPGIGYLFPLTEFVGGFDMYLRTEARYRMDAHNRRVAMGGPKHFYEGVFNVGVLIPLGELPVAEAPVEEVAVVESAPADSDGDGVPDDQDQCPDTPAGSAVSEQGCEADTDADGVVDRLDTCPDTPSGTGVNEQGCTAVADADGDGIPDDKDKCPDTPAGAAVDESGCPAQPAAEPGCRAPAPGEPISLDGCATGDAIVLRGVTFEFNSSRLTANAKVILNQVADALNARTDIKVEIGGHTDSIGSDAYNQKLSDRRSRSVYDYLVARGISPSRMVSRGYGETQPVDSNQTNEGREINRRVEMKILEGSAQ